MKVCSRCRNEKNDLLFRKNNKYSDGLFSYCLQCEKEKQTEYRRKNGILPMKKKEVYVLPDLKVCSRCNEEKSKDDFRVRLEKRENPPFPYLNNTCKKCDKEIARENYKKWRSTPEGRKRNCQWAKATYKRRRDKALAQMKKKRQTPEYKKMRNEYRQKNKDKIFQQEIITKRRYHEKNRDEISDKYAISLLRTQGHGTPEEIAKDRDLIELKKVQVLQRRIKIEIHKKKNNVKKDY